MSFVAIFTTLAEAVMIGFIVWGFFNEAKLVEMEKSLRRLIRKNSAQH